MEIKKYICSIRIKSSAGRQDSIGTGLLIGNNYILTARHVIDKYIKEIGSIDLMYDRKEYKLTKINVQLTENYAVIEYSTIIDTLPIFNERILNLSFFVEKESVIKWEAHGFLEDDRRYHPIFGNYCQSGSDEYTYVLSDIKNTVPSYSSMSGSPVVINGLIVGILKKECTIYNEPNSLIFTTLSEIADCLPSEMVQYSIYNNYHFDKINYSDLLDETHSYISRTVRPYNEISIFERHQSLLELLTSEPDKNHFIILVGEAGLGKTVELHHLAAELYKEQYNLYPIYGELKTLQATQEIEDMLPDYEKYLKNGVPVCLILDGYDEITDVTFRDTTFPQRLVQHIESINKNRKNQVVNIIISSRRNYYNKNRFINFAAMEIAPLSEIEMHQVLDNECIDANLFFSEVNNKALTNIVSNPFYFWYILDLYKKDHSLPSKGGLMDAIINQLMTKNYEKYNGKLKGITHENRQSRVFLRKIAAATFLHGQDYFSDDDYVELTDGQLDEGKKELIQCSDIFGCNDNGEYCFTHNNFREYLAAEFFNEKYKDNLKGIIEIVSIKEYCKIQDGFYNLVSFLLAIRESHDLLTWIIDNCLDDFSLFIDELDEGKKSETLIRVVDYYNSKCQVFYPEECVKLGRLVNCDEIITYFLDSIKTSSSESALFNYLRILQKSDIPERYRNSVKTDIVEFLKSESGDENHNRDAISVLAYQKLFDQDVVEFLKEQYADCENEQVLRGIYLFVDESGFYDQFIDFLIRGLTLYEKWDSYPYSLIDSISKIKEETSFVELLHFVKNITDHTYYKIKDEVKKIIEDVNFINNLEKVYNLTRNQQELFNLVVEASINLAERLYVREGLFSNFFNQTETASRAIAVYFKRYKNNRNKMVFFYWLSCGLSCYYSFLENGYKEHIFDECIGLFDFCVRSIPDNNPTKKFLIELIRSTEYLTAQNSLEYIDYNNKYQKLQEEKCELFLKYVFDYDLYKTDMLNFLESNDLTDPTEEELWNYMIYHDFINSDKELFHQMIRNFCHWRDKICCIVEKIKADKFLHNLWIVINLDKAQFDSINIMDIIPDEKLSFVETICRHLLHEYNPEDYIYYKDKIRFSYAEIGNVISLVKKYNFSIDESDIVKLIYVPASIYCSDSKEYVNGFSSWLVDELGKEKICIQIEKLRAKDLICGDFLETCLQYFISESIYKEDYINLAINNIINNENNYGDHYSWQYVINCKKQSLIIKTIKDEKMSMISFFNNIHFLLNYKDEFLIQYCSDLFDRMYVIFQNSDEKVALSEFPFLKNYTSNSDVIFNLKECLKNLLSYLIRNGSVNHTNLYLNQMIETKKYSPFEISGFNLLITYIDSPNYISQLVEILRLVSEDYFSEDVFSRMNSVIEKVLINVGCKSPKKMIEALKQFQDSKDNEYLCRMANSIADAICTQTNEMTSTSYSIEEIRDIIFN